MKRVLLLSLVLIGVGSCVVDRPPCTPQNCPGCCDEAEVCHQGNTVDFCGLQGSACLNCSPSVCKANGECFELQDFLDAGTPDANFFIYEPDGSVGVDAGLPMDAGVSDAGLSDAGAVDAGELDAGAVDAGSPIDAGMTTDAGRPDAGGMDAGVVDAGRPDAGAVDAGPLDAGRPDAGGMTDAGCPPVDRWVDPVNGADSNPGTQASPFQSLRRAASSTTCGTIWLGDGTYGPAEAPSTTSPVLLTGTVSVRAINPGQAVWGTGSTTAFSTINARAGTFLFEGFECFQPTCFNISALNAVTVTFRGVTFRRRFDSNWPTMVFLSGSQTGGADVVRATLESGGATNLCPPGPQRADRIDQWFRMSGDVHLTATQVTCDGFGSVAGPNALFSVEDARARLVLDGAVLRGLSGWTGVAGPTLTPRFIEHRRGQVEVLSSTLEALPGSTPMHGVLLGLEQNVTQAPRLTITNSTIRGLTSTVADTAHAVLLDRGGQTDQGQVFVTITDSVIERSRGGVLLRSGIGGTATLTVSNTVFRELVDGALRVENFTASNVTLTGVTADRASTGLLLGGAAAAHALTVRGSIFTGNAVRGVLLNGSAAASFDLGTVSSPGNNVFSEDAGQPFHLVANTGAMPVIFAVGNTWTASQQGADAMGRYVAVGDGGVLEFLGPTSGQNVRAANAGTRVRVAENP